MYRKYGGVEPLKVFFLGASETFFCLGTNWFFMSLHRNTRALINKLVVTLKMSSNIANKFER